MRWQTAPAKFPLFYTIFKGPGALVNPGVEGLAILDLDQDMEVSFPLESDVFKKCLPFLSIPDGVSKAAYNKTRKCQYINKTSKTKQ